MYAALEANKSRDSSIQVRRLKGCSSKSSLPDSILEKSRISLIKINKESPLLRIISTKSFCCGLSGVSNSKPVIPMTAFMGVRISWLIVARNSLLALLATSASSLAILNSSSACFFSVISVIVPTRR